jgi:hypothetical protein
MGIAKRYRLRGTHHGDRHGLRGTHSRCVTLMSAELQNAAFGLIACRIPTLKLSILLSDIQSLFDVNKPQVLPTPPHEQPPPPPLGSSGQIIFRRELIQEIAKSIENSLRKFSLAFRNFPSPPTTMGFRHNH